jgi:probable HAF family extracellular repeat protein
MKSRTWMWTAAVSLFAAVAMPVWTAAQDNPSQNNRRQHHRYRLIDMGTFGGPNFYFNFSGSPNTLLNNHGVVVGGADTATVDPYCFGNPDCFVIHASKFQDGVLHDLGALPGGSNSQAFWINGHGQSAGFAQNGMIDPLLGIQLIHAVLWSEDHIIDLGTFGGDESISQAVNDQGQVVGYATLDDNPDPFSFLGAQTHPFLWQHRVLHDLGTLGGPDAFAYLLNQSGQVAGVSLTNSIINPITGVPTTDPFLWENGNMLDLGTLGGTNGSANGLNERGEVVGQSNLAGDLVFHPFRWKRGVLTDLGTLGGDTGTAGWISDDGAVVGKADLPGSQTHHGFLWQNGLMQDLGTLGGTNICSNAHGRNASGQIIGISSDCVTSYHAALWENGGPWVDLNTLVPPHPGVQLNGLDNYINDRGEILTDGTLTNGDNHAFLLIPCDEHHPGMCEDHSMIEVADTAAAPRSSVAMTQPHNESLSGTVNPLRTPLTQRYRILGQPPIPRD